MLNRLRRIEESSCSLVSIEQTFKVEIDDDELFRCAENVPEYLLVRVAVQSELLEREVRTRFKVDVLFPVPCLRREGRSASTQQDEKDSRQTRRFEIELEGLKWSTQIESSLESASVGSLQMSRGNVRR